MPDNNIEWGQGAVNNTNDWGKAKANSTNNFGAVYDDSPSGDTNIAGGAALSITYSASAYCDGIGDTPQPTVTGNVGSGTFSSTTGLTINSTTGIIDVDASTKGATYLVTYTDTDLDTATANVTLNALDNAAFAYSDSSYAQNFSDPTPTITGLAGGTFSAGSGLVFVDSGSNTESSTGEIDLNASTIASYTITYTTSGTCPNTSTQTVNIVAELAQVNNVYSMEFDGVNDYVDTNGTVASNLDFSVSAWINPTSQDTVILGTRGLASAGTSNGFTMNINSSGNLYGRIFTETSNIIQVQTGSTISLNNWSNVAMTYNSSSKTLKTYLNGSEAGSFIGTDFSVTSTAELNIGRASVGTVYDYFDGEIDEVSVFNVELTAQEVQSIYLATEAGKTADLDDLTTPPVKWYRMGD